MSLILYCLFNFKFRDFYFLNINTASLVIKNHPEKINVETNKSCYFEVILFPPVSSS
jgi:hypothetical protein